jgi:radical SAM protein with 4Fe4S-binding SPASM domain
MVSGNVISIGQTRPPLPEELQLEVTGACNLRCRMCLVSYRPELGRSEGALAFETFRELIDGNPRLRRITLQGLGEPLLAPDLDRMVEYAAGRGVSMGFNTNAMLLTERRAERLFRAGLAWLHVSLDGARRETYEGIRGRGRFAQVACNVRAAVAVRRRLGSELPSLSLVFVAMRRNLAELPGVVELAAEWGVGRLWVQNLSHSFSDTDPAGSYREIRRFAESEALWTGADRPRAARVLDTARRRAADLGVRLRLPSLSPPPAERRVPGVPGCDWPWRAAYVTHDGRVQPCCMVMGSDRATLGRLQERSFVDVWSSDEYRAFREALLGDEPPAVCRGCSAYRGVF